MDLAPISASVSTDATNECRIRHRSSLFLEMNDGVPSNVIF
jgi:hypothetical protein